jgi:hypothetical protein
MIQPTAPLVSDTLLHNILHTKFSSTHQQVMAFSQEINHSIQQLNQVEYNDNKIVLIKELLQIKQSFRCDFNSTALDDSRQFNINNDSILIGRIVCQINSSDVTNQWLYLSDSTADIPIALINAQPSVLGHLVLCSEFNYLISGSKSYLELDGRKLTVLADAFQANNSFLTIQQAVQSNIAALFSPLPLYNLSFNQQNELVTSQLSKLHGVNKPCDNTAANPSLRPAYNSNKRKSLKAPSSANELFHLKARIISISPIQKKSEGSRFFFVEIEDDGVENDRGNNNPVSTYILFAGLDQMIWFHFLHVNQTFLFANLRITNLSNRHSATPVFIARQHKSSKWDSDKSNYCLNHSPYLSFLSKPNHYRNAIVFDTSSFTVPSYKAIACHTEDEQKVSQYSASAKKQKHEQNLGDKRSEPYSSGESLQKMEAPKVEDSNQLFSYRAVVLRQLTMCVFEFQDEKNNAVQNVCNELNELLNIAGSSLRVYFTQFSHNYITTGICLRPGSVVYLHNFHRVMRGKRFLGFAACQYSSIQILQLSDQVFPCRPYRTELYRSLATAYTRLNLYDTALFVDTLLNLKRKFNVLLASKAMIYLNSSNELDGVVVKLLNNWISFTHSVDVYQTFFNHSQTCKANIKNDMKEPFFPLIQAIFQMNPIVNSVNQLLNGAKQYQAQQSLNEKFHSQTSLNSLWNYRIIPSTQILLSGMNLIGIIRSNLANRRPNLRKLLGNELVGFNTGIELIDYHSGVDCFIQGSLPLNQLNQLIAISSFKLVLEIMLIPVSEHSLERIPVVAAYLIIAAESIQFLTTATHSGGSNVGEAAIDGINSVFFNLSRKTLEYTDKNCVECTLYGRMSYASKEKIMSKAGREDSTFPVKLHLLGQTKLYYPLFNLRSNYFFQSAYCVPTIDEDAEMCFSVNNSSQIHLIDKGLNHANLPSDLAVALHIPVPSVNPSSSVSDILQHELYSDPQANNPAQSIAAVRGVVTSKDFRSNMCFDHLPKSNKEKKIEPLAAWAISLRDNDYPHSILFYLPINDSFNSASLLPGNEITIMNVSKRISGNYNIYLYPTQDTFIHVDKSFEPKAKLRLDTCTPNYTSNDYTWPDLSCSLLPLPTRYIVEFSSYPNKIIQQLIRFRARITKFKSIKFYYRCISNCAQSFSNDNWDELRANFNRCKSLGCSFELKCSLECNIDDSTASAYLFTEEEHIIFQLISYSSQLKQAFLSQLRQSGCFTYESNPINDNNNNNDESNSAQPNQEWRCYNNAIFSSQGLEFILFAQQFFPKRLRSSSKATTGPQQVTTRELKLRLNGVSAVYSTYINSIPLCFRAVRIEQLSLCLEVQSILTQLQHIKLVTSK